MKTQIASYAAMGMVCLGALVPGGIFAKDSGNKPDAAAHVTAAPSPQAGAAAAWKDADWKDPDNRLPSVEFTSLPLSEIAIFLKQNFKDSFDILLPRHWAASFDASQAFDTDSVTVTMQLRNVSASEVFNAMNLLFETEGTPLRWQLLRNGTRQTALLKVVPELVPAGAPVPSEQKPARSIIFNGELVGDPKAGGMTVDEIVKTLQSVYKMSYGDEPVDIKVHEGAQLLVMTGTSEKLTFLSQALNALRQKQMMARQKAMNAEANSVIKSHAAAVPGQPAATNMPKPAAAPAH